MAISQFQLFGGQENENTVPSSSHPRVTRLAYLGDTQGRKEKSYLTIPLNSTPRHGTVSKWDGILNLLLLSKRGGSQNGN